MSATPIYMLSQKDLKAQAWEIAFATGVTATAIAGVILGIAMFLGAQIPPHLFVETLLVVASVVIGFARLSSYVPSPAEQRAMREIAENGSGFLGRSRFTAPQLDGPNETLDPDWMWWLIWNPAPENCERGDNGVSWQWDMPIPGDQLRKYLHDVGLTEEMQEWNSLMELERVYFDGRWLKISGSGRVKPQL